MRLNIAPRSHRYKRLDDYASHSHGKMQYGPGARSPRPVFAANLFVHRVERDPGERKSGSVLDLFHRQADPGGYRLESFVSELEHFFALLRAVGDSGVEVFADQL